MTHIGGRQARLALAPGDGLQAAVFAAVRTAVLRPVPLPLRITPEEREIHARFVAGELPGDAIWSWGG